jgi:hypothetical protein
MKKLVALMTVSLLAGSAMAAGTIRDNCGCGLGTMALGDQEPTLLSELAATFLNGICGNATFGMSSGTLECNPSAGIASNAKIQQFVAANMDRLAVDVAVGQGATLDALADLMNVPAAQRADLYTNLQSHFDAIFSSNDVSSQQVVNNLDKVVNG